ncbi:MAG: hypothetical protein ACI8ZM_004606 [Crocinitomix sp.]|jgi:hypothetical protein
MSSVLGAVLAVTIIMGIAFYLNYRMRLRNKRHAVIYESNVLKFDQAVRRNDWPEMERIGRDLLYNTSVTLIVVNKIEAKAEEMAHNYPEFEVLKSEAMNKKLRWNAIDNINNRKHWS